MAKFRTIDDRGAACELPDPGRRWWQARSFASTRELELERVRADIKRSRVSDHGRRIIALFLGLLTSGIVGVIGTMMWSYWPGWPAVAGWGSLSVITGGVLGALFLAASRPPGPTEVSARIALCPLCIACGYSRDGLPVASDGCTLCPECGSAWRTGAVVSQS